jgi:CRP/FNR family cyclic AMP-dependent transcriptional regulator
VAKKDVLGMLGSVPLFEGLSHHELSSVYEAGKEVSFEEGRRIVEEGATGVGFHLILEGEARVLVGEEEQAVLRAGDYFGEMSLLDGGPRSATVVAASPVHTLTLASWAFVPLVDKNPSIARKLLVELSRRLRNLERSLHH